MKITKIRSNLYLAAKILGDVSAVEKASRKKSTKPLSDRILRRIAGRMSGKGLGWLFRNR